jgi:hypothetical protein
VVVDKVVDEVVDEVDEVVDEVVEVVGRSSNPIYPIHHRHTRWLL